jgi:hypothetical protein
MTGKWIGIGIGMIGIGIGGIVMIGEIEIRGEEADRREPIGIQGGREGVEVQIEMVIGGRDERMIRGKR